MNIIIPAGLRSNSSLYVKNPVLSKALLIIQCGVVPYFDLMNNITFAQIFKLNYRGYF